MTDSISSSLNLPHGTCSFCDFRPIFSALHLPRSMHFHSGLKERERFQLDFEERPDQSASALMR